MTLFKSKDQFMVTPGLGFVRDGQSIYLNLSWLWFGVVFRLFDVYPNDKDGRQD